MASKIKLKQKKDKNPTAPQMSQPIQQSQVKFPYPVINDKRDLQEILEILQLKEKELNKKLQQTKVHYKENRSNRELRVKLKTLYKNYKSQLSKIETQIDYIEINFKLKKILKLREKKNDSSYKDDQYKKLKEKFEKLLDLMKNENRKYLMQSKNKSNEVDVDINESTIVRDKSPAPPIGPAQAPPDYYQSMPMEWSMYSVSAQSQMHEYMGYMTQPIATMQMQNLSQQQYQNQNIGGVSQYPPLTPYQSTVPKLTPTSVQQAAVVDPEQAKTNMIKHLIYTIAQTAAAAHATAAITAAAYNPPPPPSTATSTTHEICTVPSTTELVKAASSFAKYKDKIKNILDIDKKLVKYTNSLQTIGMEYNDDDENCNKSIDSDRSDDGYVEEDNGNISVCSENMSDTELEIVLQSNKNELNYIAPSSTPCGLHVSLDQYINEENDDGNVRLIDNLNFVKRKNPQTLAMQRSAFSLTFMGTPSILTKSSTLNKILFKS